MKFRTVNPATEEILNEYETLSPAAIHEKLNQAAAAYSHWKKTALSDRCNALRRLGKVLAERKEEYARHITLEMGKPITSAVAEVEKCAFAANEYADRATGWLEPESVQADGLEHIVRYESMGVILSIMPWNFPFWQAFRFAIPAVVAGNVSLLKHSSIVPACSMAIEEAFLHAEFPSGVFQSILADHDSVSRLILHPAIRGVSLTGSTSAGKHVAQQSGGALKKCVVELGGSDPFIVLDDADLEWTAKNAALGRLQNCGQSCIAAKRFIVHKKVGDRFTELFALQMRSQVMGDPLDPHTQIGPMVNRAGVEGMENQVADAVNKGAHIVTGGHRVAGKGFFYQPTLLTNVTSDMEVVKDETFGPVAPIIIADSDDHAVSLANNSPFGLGGSIWSRDIKRAEAIAEEIESGAVFINSITKSDPRMPFGGIKESGLGRELSHFGLHEFTNVKGYNLYKHGG
ncbi:MAG: NAD-dependent succinate-semialdehyde dehydrogenase [Verrucomicrobiota bacterium]|nr:NAD-dependent succinate-semialdehyde dehydrogenase [Verrucomicrobiota bacterium]